jgi:hypothetical protein
MYSFYMNNRGCDILEIKEVKSIESNWIY